MPHIRALRAAHGFTLTELLIVVGVIGTLAAIVMPNVLRARLSSQETSAVGSLRVISNGEAIFAATCGSHGYATDLADLARAAPGSTAGFISPDLAANSVQKSGYRFALARSASPDTVDVLEPACNGAVEPRASAYFSSAEPIGGSSSGQRFFASDPRGAIYFDFSPLANPIAPGADTFE
jgi:prepilin-type N-terminal cleavage/methylation domain-containing protein